VFNICPHIGVLIKFLTLYNYVYIRPDRDPDTLYHADRGRILNFSAFIRNGNVTHDVLLKVTCAQRVKIRQRYVKSDGLRHPSAHERAFSPEG